MPGPSSSVQVGSTAGGEGRPGLQTPPATCATSAREGKRAGALPLTTGGDLAQVGPDVVEGSHR
jgi:hypothetical protein